MKEPNTFKADLHIHTPASKCYKGNKTEDEYKQIILSARKKGIDIVAITDHNSIEGYKTLIKYKERILNDIDTLSKITDSSEAKSKISEYQSIIDSFNNLLILPGIEFEVNNGIHLLVLFNPDTNIVDIESFLHDGGYDEDSFGAEDGILSNWSIFELYKETEKYDCIVLDAHTDSDKGIFNTLPKGTTRAHAFSNPALKGVCYKNEKQRGNLQQLLNSDAKYSRHAPLAFLKSSDAHCVGDIGNEITYIRLTDLTWEQFKNAFENPAELVSTTSPTIKNTIQRIINAGPCFFITDYNIETNTRSLVETICGLANSGGGFILLGVENADVISGISGDKNINVFYENFALFWKQEIVNHIFRLVYATYNVYPLKENKYIVSVRVNRHDDLLDIDDEGIIYYEEKGKIIKLDAKKIQNVLSQKSSSKYYEQINHELSIIKKSTSVIETYFKSLPIINTYEENATYLSSIITSYEYIEPIKLTHQLTQLLEQKYKDNPNGANKGNIFYLERIQKPRLQEAYLRITLPEYRLNNLPTIKTNKEYLYIVPGGAVFYSKKNTHYFSPNKIPAFRFSITKEYPIKFLCAFLKSSYFLWFLKNKFNTIDLCNTSVFNSITIPNLHLKNPSEKLIVDDIEKVFKQILELERKFLAVKPVAEREYLSIVNNHNSETKKYFAEIDRNIYKLLKLQKEEIEIIEENLQANYIFIANDI